MSEYDVTLKTLLMGRASLALQEVTGVRITRWLNVELPQVRNHRMDLLGEAENGSLVQIELQSANDSRMALRMAEYCLSVYRLLDRFPRQILLYVGQERFRMPVELTGPDCSFRYRAVDIRELDGERLLESESVGDNVIAILARLRDAKEAVHRIVRRISLSSGTERKEALQQLLILAALRGLSRTVSEEAGRMPITESILDHPIIGQMIRDGVEEGREQGRKQGLEEGIQQGEVLILRGVLEERFGSLPPWVDERLGNASQEELLALGRRLLKAASLEALFE